MIVNCPIFGQLTNCPKIVGFYSKGTIAQEMED